MEAPKKVEVMVKLGVLKGVELAVELEYYKEFK